jgi:hypothetical protein
MNLARLYGNGRFHPIFEALAICGLLGAFASLKYAPRHYRWRFGWIVERTAQPDSSLKSVLGVVFWIVVSSVVVFGSGFSHLEPNGIDFEPLILLVVLFFYMALSRPQLMSLRLPYLFRRFWL